MKTTSIIISGLIVLFSAAFVNAQGLKEPSVRILSTDQEGIIKIVYAGLANESVEVSFFNSEGLLTKDKISKDNIQGGFIKRYDVSNINSRNFWIEISSGDMLLTYKMTVSGGGNAYVPHLEKTTLNHKLVASK